MARSRFGRRGASIHPLEDRRLMSLTVSLQTTTGATSAVVTAGQVLTLNVIATVTGADGTATSDGLQDVEGAFLSTAVGTSAVAGNLAVTGATSPFNALGSARGTAQDLNGDGHVDVGSNVTNASAVGDYFFARAGSLRTDGVVSGATMSFTIATVSYTVTAVNGGGQTNIAFRPRDTSQLPGTFASHWTEDATGTVSNEKTGTFRAGSPLRVFASSGQAATTGTVTATVYADTDGSGTRNGTETGMSAATVFVDVARTGVFATGDPSALTSSSGTATITGVPAGTYNVLEVPPTGYAQSQPVSGGYSVTVTAGGTASAGLFGLVLDGTVSGSTYTDANGNGGQDVGESAGAAGTTVYVDLNGDGAADSGDAIGATAGDGTYAIADVPPGSWSVRAVAPSGYAVTQPTSGGSTVTVGAGQAVVGATFGFAPAGTVTGIVFTDTGGDGSQGVGDAGLAGVTVHLDVNSDGSPSSGDMTTTTDADGAFTLATAIAGTYTLRIVVPTGDTLSTPAGGSESVTVALGATVTAGSFGVVPPATSTPTATTGSIGGAVHDGAGAALAGATIYLDANGNGQLDAGEVTATSAADGTYSFADLEPGGYAVRPLIPLGDVVSTPAAGSYALTVAAGGTDSATDFTLAALPASSLTLAVASTSAKGVIAGATGTLKVRVGNGGAAPFAGPVTFDIYASAKGSVSTQDVAIGTVTRTLKLKPGKSAVVAVKYTYPLAMGAGSYHLVAAASSGSTTAPATATALGTVAVTAATVDLSPTIVAAAAGVVVKPGKNGAVTVRIANGGTVTAIGTVTITIYATATGAADSTAVVIGSVADRKVKIAAGKASALKVAFAAPTALTPGAYQLVAVMSAVTTPVDLGSVDTSAAVATR